jgi:hypothetical protein
MANNVLFKTMTGFKPQGQGGTSMQDYIQHLESDIEELRKVIRMSEPGGALKYLTESVKKNEQLLGERAKLIEQLIRDSNVTQEQIRKLQEQLRDIAEFQMQGMVGVPQDGEAADVEFEKLQNQNKDLGFQIDALTLLQTTLKEKAEQGTKDLRPNEITKLENESRDKQN